MRKLLIITVALSSLLPGCNKEKKSVQPSLMEASKQELASALEERDELLHLVSEISESMEQVRDLESSLASSDQGNNDERNRDRILNDIAVVHKTLQLRKRQLKEMEERLENSSLYSDELKGVIHTLKKQLNEQAESIKSLRKEIDSANQKIISLNKEVDSLNCAVATVNEKRSEAEANTERLESQLNTCYMVADTKSELKKHHIIEASFLKRKKILPEEFDKSVFSAYDRRHLDTIDLNSTKAEILTQHPKDSYELIDVNRKKFLHITDPDKFWSLTNYLVIQID